jgi:2,5-diamino-6-(ribosylamino)-4(3H)-pyrimidinone 5'-phosphate reductase
MVYNDLAFPTLAGRPYVFANFVQTVDGKVNVLANPRAYWPLGSETDHETLLQLRAHADVMLHGKHTAVFLRHLDKLGTRAFQERRGTLGKDRPMLYGIISAHPDGTLAPYLENPPPGTSSLLITTREARVPINVAAAAQVVRFGDNQVDLHALSGFLHEQGHRTILLEGGPTLLASFLAADLLDELFVTIAPKIVGSKNHSTLTMVEGTLFAPDQVKRLQLISVRQVEDEVYLRYLLRRKD